MVTSTYTNGTFSYVPMVCTECGQGNYSCNLSALQHTWACTNPECDHSITGKDVDPYLDEGETFAYLRGLAVIATEGVEDGAIMLSMRDEEDFPLA